MTNLCCNIRNALYGRTLVTAESCTGGGIGAALTAVSGISSVYKGGVISYCDELKHTLLGVPTDMLKRFGAVSAPVAEAMASGVRRNLNADVAVSVTGLAGPDADQFGNPVGTVYIGYSDENTLFSRKFLFTGDRNQIQMQAIHAALEIVLAQNMT